MSLTPQFKRSSQKDADLKTLSDWITKTTSATKKAAPGLKQQKAGMAYFFDSQIDFDNFSRKDLLSLQPALEKLHQVCKEADISIDLRGFDMLPVVALVAKHASTNGKINGSFIIYVDARHGYNFAFNPFSENDLKGYWQPKP